MQDETNVWMIQRNLLLTSSWWLKFGSGRLSSDWETILHRNVAWIVANQSYKKGRGNWSFTEPVGVESLKEEKWPLLGPTTVSIKWRFCDVTCIRFERGLQQLEGARRSVLHCVWFKASTVVLWYKWDLCCMTSQKSEDIVLSLIHEASVLKYGSAVSGTGDQWMLGEYFLIPLLSCLALAVQGLTVSLRVHHTSLTIHTIFSVAFMRECHVTSQIMWCVAMHIMTHYTLFLKFLPVAVPFTWWKTFSYLCFPSFKM